MINGVTVNTLPPLKTVKAVKREIKHKTSEIIFTKYKHLAPSSLNHALKYTVYRMDP